MLHIEFLCKYDPIFHGILYGKSVFKCMLTAFRRDRGLHYIPIYTINYGVGQMGLRIIVRWATVGQLGLDH